MLLIAFATRRWQFLAAAFLIFLAVSFAFPSKGYYAGMYLVDFTIGAAVIGIAPRLASVFRAWRGIPALGLTLCYMVAFRSDLPPTHHIPALACAVLVCTILNRPVWDILESRVLARIGDISYSVYVLHYPIMCTIATLMSLAIKTSSHLMALIHILVTVLTTLRASELVYRHVALPGIPIVRMFINYFSKLLKTTSGVADEV
jgi:peptidoglycan/LPS O-acetylase OafA/YrhL